MEPGSPVSLSSLPDALAREDTDRAATPHSALKAFVNDPRSSTCAAVFQASVLVLIIASSTAVIVETLPEYRHVNFQWLEAIVTIIFTAELVLRLAVSESLLGFFSSGFNVVDIVAVMPGYFEFFSWANTDAIHAALTLRILRIMWFIRILRLFKFARHFPFLSFSINLLYQVLTSSALLILVVLGFLMVVSASLLYLVESVRCEELGVPCDRFESIPASFWFAICTLTTVGYGDTIPVTSSGKLVAAFIAVCAVIIMALSGALLYFHFCQQVQWEPEPGHPDAEEEVRKVRELREAWDQLHQKLAVAAHARVLSRPTLQLLEDRGRCLCAEMQGCLNVLLRASEKH